MTWPQTSISTYTEIYKLRTEVDYLTRENTKLKRELEDANWLLYESRQETLRAEKTNLKEFKYTWMYTTVSEWGMTFDKMTVKEAVEYFNKVDVETCIYIIDYYKIDSTKEEV